MKQKFKDRLATAFSDDYIANLPEQVTIFKGASLGPTSSIGKLFDEFMKTHTLKSAGNRISQGPNRHSRRKMWKSIQRKDRIGWKDSLKQYHELQAVNKPVRWEVTTTN